MLNEHARLSPRGWEADRRSFDIQAFWLVSESRAKPDNQSGLEECSDKGLLVVLLEPGAGQARRSGRVRPHSPCKKFVVILIVNTGFVHNKKNRETQESFRSEGSGEATLEKAYLIVAYL